MGKDTRLLYKSNITNRTIMKIAVIGNYPPRKCGIATFTQNFIDSLLQQPLSVTKTRAEVEVFAMNDREEGYPYPPIVKYGIRKDVMEDYNRVIEYINNSGFSYCHIQHEYGIFGGISGIYVMQFLARINIPIAITLHTVLDKPDFYQRKILTAIGLAASKVFVMGHTAIRFLQTIYGIDREKIEVIEHGTPVFENLQKPSAKEELGLKQQPTILTFGLVGRSKGIEIAIKALPDVVKKHPDIQYIVLGKTHPHVVAHEGESYRESLESLALELGVSENIIFLNQYATEDDLVKYLSAADIYITPYLNECQITSGTLCYAVASGAAVVSTPYWHASEILSNEVGLLFPFHDYNMLSQQLNNLLDNPEKLNNYQKAAFEYGQSISWPTIGAKYFRSLTRMIFDNEAQLHPFEKKNIRTVLLHCTPELRLDHLERMNDDFGILQHATYIFPNFKEGYCTDDNSRAMIFATMYYQKTKSQQALALIKKYLSFINYMRNDDGSYGNFIGYNKTKPEPIGSEDSFGRALWSLGYLMHHAPDRMMSDYAAELFSYSFDYIPKLKSLRGKANTLLGLYWFYKTHSHNQHVKHLINELSGFIMSEYQAHSSDNWHWFENIVAYDNAIISLSLWHAWEILDKAPLKEIALESTDFIIKTSTCNGHLSLVGNEDWLIKGGKKPQFGQQAIDALALIQLCKKTFEITKLDQYSEALEISYTWFLGNNDVYIPLYDNHTHGCCDGLEKYGVNRNQGAESLLSWLISSLVYNQK